MQLADWCIREETIADSESLIEIRIFLFFFLLCIPMVILEFGYFVSLSMYIYRKLVTSREALSFF